MLPIKDRILEIVEEDLTLSSRAIADKVEVSYTNLGKILRPGHYYHYQM